MTRGETPVHRIATVCCTILACALAAPQARATITGVCPDGSIYIVPRAALIPCRDSKQVRPEEVPPLKPEMLPQPYGWEVFNRRNDPNNPYNLVDKGRAVRGEPPATGAEPSDEAPTTEVRPQESWLPDAPETEPRTEASARSPLPPVAAGTPGPPATLDLGLAPDEVRDLALIVEYSQQRAPATLVRGADSDPPAMVLRVAQSPAFEARLRDALLRAGRPLQGPVVLFSAVAGDDEAFYANLTFVQNHLAFRPDAAVAHELGLIEGRLGRLGPQESVLGYVVLPPTMDLHQPVDIYWDDRQITATLRP